MRVGFLPAIGSSLWSFNATGQAERLYAHARWYEQAGHRVDWFTYHPQDMAWPFGDRVSVQSWLAPLRSGAWRACEAFRALNLLGALPAVVARARWGTPFVLSYGADYETLARIHGRPAWKWRWLRRLVLPMASAVLVSNRELAQRLRGLHPTARILDHPNWVDLKLFQPMEHGERWARPVRRVYYVGRLVKEKNLVDAAVAVRAAGARFVCVGGGPLAEEIRRAGAETVGVQPWPSLPGWLADAEAFIMPSLSEGQPKALLEAMACGVPAVISAALTGFDDAPLIRALGVNFVSAIRNLLATGSAARDLGERGRQWVSDHFAAGPLMRREIDEVCAA